MRRLGLVVSMASLGLTSTAIALDGPRWRGPDMNGLIYCRDAQGNLVCLDVAEKQSAASH